VIAVVTLVLFFFQAEDGIRDFHVTGVQTCALPIFSVSRLKPGSGAASPQPTRPTASSSRTSTPSRASWRTPLSTSGATSGRRYRWSESRTGSYVWTYEGVNVWTKLFGSAPEVRTSTRSQEPADGEEDAVDEQQHRRLAEERVEHGGIGGAAEGADEGAAEDGGGEGGEEDPDVAAHPEGEGGGHGDGAGDARGVERDAGLAAEADDERALAGGAVLVHVADVVGEEDGGGEEARPEAGDGGDGPERGARRADGLHVERPGDGHRPEEDEHEEIGEAEVGEGVAAGGVEPAAQDRGGADGDDGPAAADHEVRAGGDGE